MKIGKKLVVSFSIIIVILLILSIFSIGKMKEIDNNYTFLLEDRVYKVKKYQKFKTLRHYKDYIFAPMYYDKAVKI